MLHIISKTHLNRVKGVLNTSYFDDVLFLGANNAEITSYCGLILQNQIEFGEFKHLTINEPVYFSCIHQKYNIGHLTSMNMNYQFQCQKQ